MSFRIIAQDTVTGIDYQIELSDIDGSNIVLRNVACDASVFVKSVVRMDNLGVAQNALADDVSTSNIIGVVEAKPTSTTCDIRVTGVSPAIFTGLDVTKDYYLSDVNPGEITTNIPTTANHVRAKVGQPFSATEFLVLKGELVVRG